MKDRLWFFGAYDRVDTPGTTSRYVSSKAVPDSLQFPRDQTDILASGKLTWSPASGTTLVATAFSDPSEVTGAARAGTVNGLISSPDPGTWQSRREIGGTDGGLRVSRLVGSVGVLEVQAARHRDRFELFPSGPGAAVRFEDWTCAGGTPQLPCNSPVSPNFASGGMGIVGGPHQRNSSRRDQLRADLDFYFGSHQIRAGGDYQDSMSTLVTGYTGGQQVERYNEFGQTYYSHNFIAASPSDPTPADAIARPHHIDESLYIQDSWSAGPGLTVNAGLRWDEENLLDVQGSSLFKTTAEWQPRLGVVWDPSRTGRMKFYASAGRFYYSLPTDIGAFTSPIVRETTYNFDPVDKTQNPDVIGHGTASLSPTGGDLVDHGLKGIYQDELTLGFETLLDPTFAVGVKGTYRRLGRAIESRCDLDFNLPENGNSGCAIVNPGSGGKYASGDSRLQRPGWRRRRVPAGRAGDAGRSPAVSRSRGPGPKERGRPALAPSLVRPILASGQLRWRSERGFGRNESGCLVRLRLSAALDAQLLWEALSRPAERLSRGRELPLALRAARWPSGLRAVGRAARKAGVLRLELPSRHSARAERRRRTPSNALGGEPDPRLSGPARGPSPPRSRGTCSTSSTTRSRSARTRTTRRTRPRGTPPVCSTPPSRRTTRTTARSPRARTRGSFASR